MAIEADIRFDNNDNGHIRCNWKYNVPGLTNQKEYIIVRKNGKLMINNKSVMIHDDNQCEVRHPIMRFLRIT